MNENFSNFVNAGIGFTGWFLATAPTWFDNINGVIAILSSALGLVLLFITIRTGIVNYRMKKIEHYKLRRELKEIIDEEN